MRGILTISHGFPWNSHDFPWISWKYREMPGIQNVWISHGFEMAGNRMSGYSKIPESGFYFQKFMSKYC